MTRHNEICELHPSVALWLQSHKLIYTYENWLNKHNRVDFLAFDMYKNQFVICEVGNFYDNTQDLVDKFLQCARYKSIFPSYHCILFLPSDYHKNDDYVNYLSNLYEIEIVFVEIHDFIDNYDDFYKIIYPDYYDDDKPNIGIFKRF